MTSLIHCRAKREVVASDHERRSKSSNKFAPCPARSGRGWWNLSRKNCQLWVPNRFVNEPSFLTNDEVLLLHVQSLREHGGTKQLDKTGLAALFRELFS